LQRLHKRERERERERERDFIKEEAEEENLKSSGVVH